MGSCLSSDGQRGSPTSATAAASEASMKQRKRPRKTRRPQGLSSDSKRDEQLHRIPGRMFLNGATSTASLFTQQGKKGINQDAMVVWENFCSRTGTIFCGVFDGHGPFGHRVAKRVRDSLPLKISTQWELNIGGDDVRENGTTARSMNSEESASVCTDKEPGTTMDFKVKGKDPEIYMTLKESFLKAFNVMDKELRMHPNIDCFCSGTTAVTLVKQGQDLVIGNIGDSRAILGTRDENNCLVAVQLTVDLKPNLPREAERIRRCRGRVFALNDEPEVARVWLPNNDSPGLAMARAFGDFCLKDFGLISVPEISYRRLTEPDEFIVLATDGIWDVLSNKEVVDIISSSPTRSSASRSLVESAIKAWRLKYPTSKIDDCAAVCLFLDADASDDASTDTEFKEIGGESDMHEIGSNKQEPSSPIALDRSGTVCYLCEIFQGEVKEASKQIAPRSQISSNRSTTKVEVGDWSALEGVSRANTMLTLPSLIDEDKHPTNAPIFRNEQGLVSAGC